MVGRTRLHHHLAGPQWWPHHILGAGRERGCGVGGILGSERRAAFAPGGVLRAERERGRPAGGIFGSERFASGGIFGSERRAALVPGGAERHALSRRTRRSVPRGGVAAGVLGTPRQRREGLPWLAAAERCRDRGLALCTEAQWSRACEVSPDSASTETWTASADGARGFVARGGARCEERRVAEGPSASRAGACCTWAIALRGRDGDGGGGGDLAPAQRVLLAYEAVLDREAPLPNLDLL